MDPTPKYLDSNNTLLFKIATAIADGVGVSGVSSFNFRVGPVTLFSSDVTDALGFTPADENDVVTSFNGRQGIVTLLSADVTAALGFTPADATNVVNSFNARQGIVTLLSADVTTALGFTPANVANPLSQFAATTSAQLAGVITDETGTGLLVFNDSPTFTTELTVIRNALGTTTNEGVSLINQTASVGPLGRQVSPALSLLATSFDLGDSLSHVSTVRLYNLPAIGTSLAQLVIDTSIDAGAATTLCSMVVNAAGSGQISVSGAEGKVSVNSAGTGGFFLSNASIRNPINGLNGLSFVDGAGTSFQRILFGTTSNVVSTHPAIGRDGAALEFFAADAASTIALRLYNTRTSSTNFERLTTVWTANVCNLWTEKGSGGGTARNLVLGTDATARMTFSLVDIAIAAEVNFTPTTIAGIRLNNLTTAQRTALATPLAGQVIWNTSLLNLSYYNSAAWRPIAATLSKSGDQTINGNAFQNITDLTFAMAANTDYSFEFNIAFSCVNSTTGAGWSVNGPAGFNLLSYVVTYQTTANATAGTDVMSQRHDVAYDAMAATTLVPTGGVTLHVNIKGIVRNGANSGTLAARVRSELANNDLVVRQGSWGTWFAA